MKEELKTEHIVGYLPYGLLFDGKRNGWVSFDGNIKTLCPIDLDGRWGLIVIRLIPLHALTQDQLVHFSICFRLWYDKPNFDYKLMIYQDIETCHKLHVDYRGLIEKGLAIKK